MNRKFIEKKAHDLHKDIWQEKASLWPEGAPEPIGMLEPQVAARILDVDFYIEVSLGQFGDSGNPFEVAGAINRQKRTISVSQQFQPDIMRFTGAHEIGHWILHHDEVMHRDRPINGSKVARELKEKEADYFAACFLMPAKLLRSKIKQTFGMELPIRVDENIAFWLCPNEPDDLVRPTAGSDARERVFASAKSFRGRHFVSLAEQFRVSPAAMAIRLKEIGTFEQP